MEPLRNYPENASEEAIDHFFFFFFFPHTGDVRQKLSTDRASRRAHTVDLDCANQVSDAVDFSSKIVDIADDVFLPQRERGGDKPS